MRPWAQVPSCRCPGYSAHLRDGGPAGGVSSEQPVPGSQARGPASILTCLSSQAPALQQYRTSAGSPANQSPTSPVSNQGFSPGSSPQVRDAASPPRPPPLQPSWHPPHVSPIHLSVRRLCLPSHSTPSCSLHAILFTPPGWGPVRGSHPGQWPRRRHPLLELSHSLGASVVHAKPQVGLAGSPFASVTLVSPSPQLFTPWLGCRAQCAAQSRHRAARAPVPTHVCPP